MGRQPPRASGRPARRPARHPGSLLSRTPAAGAALAFAGLLAGCTAAAASPTPSDLARESAGLAQIQAQAQRVANPPTLAVVGDSYSLGSALGGTGTHGWPALVATHYNAALDLRAAPAAGFTNVAHDPPFPRWVPTVVAADPAVVVVWGARNDAPASGGALESAVRGTLDMLKAGLPSAEIVVIGPAWVDGKVPVTFTHDRDVERAVARSEGVPFIDPLAEGWFAGSSSTLIGADGVHPTDAGHRHLAELIEADFDRLGVATALG